MKKIKIKKHELTETTKEQEQDETRTRWISFCKGKGETLVSIPTPQ